MQSTTMPPPPLRQLAPLHLSSRTTAIMALVLGATLYGFGAVSSKGALDGIPPLTLAAGRFAIAAVVLTALCRARGIRPAYDARAVLLGLTGIAMPYTFQNLGLREASAGSTALLVAGGIPILVAGIGVAVLGERIGGRRLAGLALGVGGVTAVALDDLGAGAPLVGSLLGLGAAAWFAVFTVLGRKVYRGGFSLAVLSGGTTVGALLLGPLAAVEVGAGDVPSPNSSDLMLLLFLGIVGSTATQLLWAHGMAHLEASEIGVFGTFTPVVGVAAAAIFLGESVAPAQLAGGALIVAGMFTTARSSRLRWPRLTHLIRRPAAVGLA